MSRTEGGFYDVIDLTLNYWQLVIWDLQYYFSCMQTFFTCLITPVHTLHALYRICNECTSKRLTKMFQHYTTITTTVTSTGWAVLVYEHISLHLHGELNSTTAANECMWSSSSRVNNSRHSTATKSVYIATPYQQECIFKCVHTCTCLLIQCSCSKCTIMIEPATQTSIFV